MGNTDFKQMIIVPDVEFLLEKYGSNTVEMINGMEMLELDNEVEQIFDFIYYR